MKCDDYDGSKLDEQHHHHAFPTQLSPSCCCWLTRHFRSRTGPGRFHALKHLLGDPRLPL